MNPQDCPLMSSLALAIDPGAGIPMQTVHRNVLVAVRLGEVAGLSEADLKRACWMAFLRYVGGTTAAHRSSWKMRRATAHAALAGFGDFKPSHMLGHARRVASLAAASASAASLPRSTLKRFRRPG